MNIRPLQLSDLETPIFDDRSRPGGEWSLRRQADGLAYIAVAEVDNDPVGRIGLDFERSKDAGVAYMWEAHVEDAWRGKGIGSALIAHLESVAAARGCTAVDVAVVKDNDRARRLYERLGYRPYGEGVDRWSFTGENGETAFVEDSVWILRKLLAQ